MIKYDKSIFIKSRILNQNCNINTENKQKPSSDLVFKEKSNITKLIFLISVGCYFGCYGKWGEYVFPQGGELLVTAKLGGLEGGENPGKGFRGDVLQELRVEVDAVKREGVALLPRLYQVRLL